MSHVVCPLQTQTIKQCWPLSWFRKAHQWRTVRCSSGFVNLLTKFNWEKEKKCIFPYLSTKQTGLFGNLRFHRVGCPHLLIRHCSSQASSLQGSLTPCGISTDVAWRGPGRARASRRRAGQLPVGWGKKSGAPREDHFLLRGQPVCTSSPLRGGWEQWDPMWAGGGRRCFIKDHKQETGEGNHVWGCWWPGGSILVHTISGTTLLPVCT
jgi:hypothetical protein